MGTDHDKMLLPAVLMSDGKYHIPSSLITSRPSMAKKILQNCNAIAVSLGEKRVTCPLLAMPAADAARIRTTWKTIHNSEYMNRKF
jgi:hypothetical protein